MSIYDIAKRAGVSTATVSKALNGYKNINEETRNRIKLIADEIGYFPNASARALITKTNFLVGVLFSDDLKIGLEHPIFSGIIENFKNRMESYGYDTIFITSKIGNRKTSYLEHCSYRNVDGVYIATFYEGDSLLLDLMKSKIKCVTTDLVSDIRIPIIMPNNYQGMELSIDYLVSLGHKKIGHIGGPISNSIAARERLDGFKKYMTKHKLDINENYIEYASNFEYSAGYNAGLSILNKCNGDLPTAFIAASDIIAIGFMNALKTANISVPEDVSIIGFDDIDVAKYITPSLTTVRQNLKKTGEKIADVLLASIEEKEVLDMTQIDVELIKRDSCRTIK